MGVSPSCGQVTIIPGLRQGRRAVVRLASRPETESSCIMSDGLYEHDILSWSEHQADRLRRLARGEMVNGVDWVHVVEEIEDVGLSELHAAEGALDLMLVHLGRCMDGRQVHRCSIGG
jgi:hypothetical protein